MSCNYNTNTFSEVKLSQQNQLSKTLKSSNNKREIGEALKQFIGKSSLSISGDLDKYPTITIWSGNHNNLTKHLFRNTDKTSISIYGAIKDLKSLFNLGISSNRLKELKQLFKFNAPKEQKSRGYFIPKAHPLFQVEHYGDNGTITISEVNYSDHFRYKRNYQKIYLPEHFDYFYKTLKIDKPFHPTTEKIIRELFYIGDDGKIYMFYKQSSPTTKGLDSSDLPKGSAEKRKYWEKEYFESFKRGSFFSNIGGLNPDSLNPYRDSDSAYYSVHRNNSELEIGRFGKYSRPKSPRGVANYKAPIIYLSDFYNPEANPDRVESAYIVEGFKDYLTLHSQLMELGETNFIIVLALGVSEFSSKVEFISHKFPNIQKIRVVADDDNAGFTELKRVFEKAHFRSKYKLQYLNWNNLSDSTRENKSDITDYRNKGYKLSISHFSDISNLVGIEKEKIEYKNFYTISSKKSFFSEVVEESEKLKEAIFNTFTDLIIQSPMNSGKSHFLAMLLNNAPDGVHIITTPLTKLRKELEDKGSYPFQAFINGSDSNHFSMTIQALNKKENLKEFERELIDRIGKGEKITFWVDEAHKHSKITAKLRVLYGLKERFSAHIRIIYITATAKYLFERDFLNSDVMKFDIQTKKLRFKTLLNHTVEKKNEISYLLHREYNNKTAILLNSDKKSIALKEKLTEKGLQVKIINSKSKNFDFTEADVFIVTSVTEYGLNFYGSGVDTIIGVNLDPLSFTQYVGRFRDRAESTLINLQTERKGLKLNSSNRSYSTLKVKFSKKKNGFDFDKNTLYIDNSELSILDKQSARTYLQDEFEHSYFDVNKFSNGTAYLRLHNNQIHSDSSIPVFLDKRGEKFDDMGIIEERYNSVMNLSLFNQIINEYIDIEEVKTDYIDNEHIDISTDREQIERTATTLAINIEKVYGHLKETGKGLDKRVTSELEKSDNIDYANMVTKGVVSKRSLEHSLGLTFSIETFLANHFHNSRASSIYEQILFVKAIEHFVSLYGESVVLSFLKKMLKDGVVEEKISREVINIASSIKLIKDFNISKDDFKRAGLSTFSKEQRRVIYERNRIQKFLNGELDSTKIGLKEFDDSLISEENILSYIDNSEFLSKLKEGFEKLKIPS